jgi:hypothetical protein
VAEIPAGPARRSEDGFLSAWQRLAVGICVALPVPVFAGTGLALPLPSVVYRLAVAAAERTEAVAVHLSGFKVVTAQEATAARVGTISLTESERSVAVSVRDPGPTIPGHTSTSRSAGTSHLTTAVSKVSSRPDGDAGIVREAAPVLGAPGTDGREPEGGSTSHPPEAPAATGEATSPNNGSAKEKGGRSDDQPDKARTPQPEKGSAKAAPNPANPKAATPGHPQASVPDEAQGEPQNDKPKDQGDPQAGGPGQDQPQAGNDHGGVQDLGPSRGTGQDGSAGGGSDKTPPGKAG